MMVLRRGWSRVSERIATHQATRGSATTASAPPPPPPHTLKVISYNILADKYALGGYHSYCPPEYLAWSHRLPLIMEELDGYNMDLLMLQEVEQASFDNEFLPMMRNRGYEGSFLARHLPEVAGPPEGVALFFRASLFRLVHEMHHVIFSDSPPFQLPTRTGSRELDECVDQFLKRPEGALLALLEHLPSKKLVLAASVHLFWNPRYPDVKVLQAMALCSEIKKLLENKMGTIDVPVVIGGDFNSIASKRIPDAFDKEIPPGGELVSGVYQLMTTGYLPPDHIDHPTTRRFFSPPPVSAEDLTALTSAYSSSGLGLYSVQAASVGGAEPPITTKTGSFAGTLDYIFINRHWKVLSVLDLPYPVPGPKNWKDPLLDIPFSPVPSDSFPSDHLAIGGEIQLL